MTAWWMLLRRLLAGLLVAHLGGVGLLALAVAVEAPPGTLVDTLGARIPSTWASSAAVLTVLGSALAAIRARSSGLLLGLGTLGVSPGRLVVLAALAGALLGLGTSQVLRPEASTLGWTRVEGGWVHQGVSLPDVPGTELRPPSLERAPLVPLPVAMGTGASAGVTGVMLGLVGGAVGPVITAAVTLVAEAVCQGLVERGALPPGARMAPAGILLIVALTAWTLRPLFPKRR